MKEWKEQFERSKPLITYAIISGLDTKTIAKVFNQIRVGLDPSEMHIEQAVLDRVPKLDRPDYEFPATAPIFLEGYNIMKEHQSPKAIPIVLTSTSAGRRYGIALMFYEDLKDYILAFYNSSSKLLELDEEDFEENKKDNLEMDPDRMLLEDRIRNGTITEDARESLSLNPFQQIQPFLVKLKQQDLTGEGIFNGVDYFIPKSIILISDQPIFETLEQIIRHIYRQCINGIEYPLEEYLSYLTHEAPLPPIGTSITYSLPNFDTFKIENKLLNELPAVPTNFYSEFFLKSVLNMQNLYDLIYWFMCQMGTTVFISESVNR